MLLRFDIPLLITVPPPNRLEGVPEVDGSRASGGAGQPEQGPAAGQGG